MARARERVKAFFKDRAAIIFVAMMFGATTGLFVGSLVTPHTVSSTEWLSHVRFCRVVGSTPVYDPVVLYGLQRGKYSDTHPVISAAVLDGKACCWVTDTLITCEPLPVVVLP